MTTLHWILGLAISAWVGAMGLSALFRTNTAKIWFGDMLKQSPTVMTLNGIGILIAALIVLLNLLIPAKVGSDILIWGLIGIITSQFSTLIMLIRGKAQKGAIAAPVVLLVLTIIYLIVRM